MNFPQRLPRGMGGDALAGVEGAPLQGGGGEHVEGVAVGCWGFDGGFGWALRVLHLPQHATGALRDLPHVGVGATHQCRRHRRLTCVQPVGGFAKQRAAQCVDAHQLAAKRHQVEVGLEDFVLAPAALQHLRIEGLADLSDHRAAPGGATFAVQQTGQLHGDGGRAPGAGVPQVGPGRRRDGLPVHAAVFVKPLVLGQQQRGAQRG